MLINDANRIYLGATEVLKAYLGTSLVWSKPTPVLKSSNLISSNGLTVGASNMKDMTMTSSTYTTAAAYVPGSNALSSRRTYWADWGGDIFDGWGFFYIYNPATGRFLSPLLTDINRENGYIATETFTLDGRTFTVKHGYPVTGIYKFDISVNDSNPFIFGTDGQMGSNSATVNEDKTYSTNIDGEDVTIFYNYNVQITNPLEAFYSYWVPYVISEGTTKTYTDYRYDTDHLAIYSKLVTRGITVYMAKQNDVRQWVAEDLSII
jgi:hypothetical protein